MGLYIRQDSKYYWMRLEHPGAKPESTRVLHASDQPAVVRKQQRDDAMAIYRARMTELARSDHQLPRRGPTIGFSTYAEWFDEHHIAKHRGAARDREIMVPLRAFFADRDLGTIDQPLVHEYMTHRMDDDVSARTVNREVDVLKSMLHAAVPRYLSASPLVGMKRLRIVKPAKRLLTHDEETRLLAQLPPADQALFVVALDTLMRLSNVLDLKRSEDKGNFLALTDSKTGPYTVPLSARARAALDSLPANGDYYFSHRRGAKTARDRRGAIRRMLERACDTATPKIPYGRAVAGITFHTATRATGATRMLQAGHDPRTVQEVGNWADFRAMAEYLHTDQARKTAAVNSIAPESATPALRSKAKQRKHARKHKPKSKR